MVEVVKRYVCDSCNKQICVSPDETAKEWVSSEVGDLCPSCARAWVNYKESFKERMCKDSGAAIVSNRDSVILRNYNG